MTQEERQRTGSGTRSCRTDHGVLRVGPARSAAVGDSASRERGQQQTVGQRECGCCTVAQRHSMRAMSKCVCSEYTTCNSQQQPYLTLDSTQSSELLAALCNERIMPPSRRTRIRHPLQSARHSLPFLPPCTLCGPGMAVAWGKGIVVGRAEKARSCSNSWLDACLHDERREAVDQSGRGSPLACCC